MPWTKGFEVFYLTWKGIIQFQNHAPSNKKLNVPKKVLTLRSVSVLFSFGCIAIFFPMRNGIGKITVRHFRSPSFPFLHKSFFVQNGKGKINDEDKVWSKLKLRQTHCCKLCQDAVLLIALDCCPQMTSPHTGWVFKCRWVWPFLLHNISAHTVNGRLLTLATEAWMNCFDLNLCR